MQDTGDADAFGITPGWWSTDGTFRPTDPGTAAALRAELGGPDGGDPPAAAPVWFVTHGDPAGVWSPGVVELEEGGEVTVHDHLPPDLPLGAHTLDSGGTRTDLYVVPPRAPRLPEGWGWAVQLPGLRSGGSWGTGDLADLAGLAVEARRAGASVVAHSPIGAVIPGPAPQRSPYYPSSRRFPSPLYLRVEDVPGARLAAGAVAAAARAGHALNRGGRLDHAATWRLKLGALAAIWDAVGTTPSVRGELEAAAADPELTDHAVFCTLSEVHGGGRSAFPAPLSRPGNAEVRRAAVAHADRVDFWRWVQLRLDDQWAAAARAGAPLMADLPVGFDPDGADAWCDAALLAEGCRVGAPPDDFAPDGQDWGLVPYVPWRLRADRYRPWRSTLRRLLRHAGCLRIDHVMGLFRLYLIPPGATAAHGAYVQQIGDELLDLACLEAARAGAALVGEDLGTVEPRVREAMGARGVAGYRVGWFEDDPPADWPAGSVGMLGTHDLPTVAGLWTGTDAADRAAAGRAPDPDGDRLLRGRLRRLAGVDDTAAAAEVALAAHRALGRAGSTLVLAQPEDALGVQHRVNLPGTVDEHPNWSLPLPVTLERFRETTAATATALTQGRTERPTP